MMLVSRTYWAGMPFWFRRPPEAAAVEALMDLVVPSIEERLA